MRIVKIARRPASYWKGLYATRPDAATLPYAQQKAWFCADFFGPVDIWETYLGRAGHQAIDFISGIAPLDAAWAKEHGDPSTDFALLLNQVIDARPEALILEAIQSFSVQEIRTLRERVPTLRALIGVTGVDLRNRPELAAVDVVMTCMPNQVDHIRNAGGKSVYLPWWFDPRILDRLPGPRKVNYGVTFVGNIEQGPHLHDARRELLVAMAEDVDLTVFTNADRRIAPRLTRYATTKVAYELARAIDTVGIDARTFPVGPIRNAAFWTTAPKFPNDLKLRSRIRPSFYGIRMFELLRQSRVSLNMHVTLAERYAANMRLFEATGAGSCLLTDWKENLGNFFDDTEVVSYKNTEEAIEKATYLMAHPAEADQIALRGQQRTLASHGFDKRIPMIEEAIALAVR